MVPKFREQRPLAAVMGQDCRVCHYLQGNRGNLTATTSDALLGVLHLRIAPPTSMLVLVSDVVWTYGIVRLEQPRSLTSIIIFLQYSLFFAI